MKLTKEQENYIINGLKENGRVTLGGFLEIYFSEKEMRVRQRKEGVGGFHILDEKRTQKVLNAKLTHHWKKKVRLALKNK